MDGHQNLHERIGDSTEEVKIKLTPEETKILTNESEKRNINLSDLIKHLALAKVNEIKYKPEEDNS